MLVYIFPSGMNLFGRSWILLVASLAFIFGTGMDTADNRALYDQQVDWMLKHITFKTGDLVFRRGKSAASQAVLLTDQNSCYSHVGILSIVKGRCFVIHSVPYEEGNGNDEMKCERLESFLSFEKASRAAVYRVRQMSDADLIKAVEWARRAFDSRVKFDADYNLLSDDKLYCTELIWKSFLAAGTDLVGKRFDDLNIPLKGGRYIFPGRLIMNPLLVKIHSL
ncbi:MAG: YiiX/YebB-like N1pC/P60 family cysteine hydrolase [Bacteroidetes bacterium]|nr:YiiX/YebB-like N1pC/P60 family cysteine hydrolase [Bacteroidota bacterium]